MNISDLPTELVLRQISSALQKGNPRAVKVGFIANADTIESLCSIIQNIPHKVMVPSIIDSSGRRMLSTEAIDMGKRKLFPLADLLIMKVCEAELVLGMKICTDNDMLRASELLCQMGAKAVMLRGGEIREGYLSAVLMHEGGHQFFSSRNMKAWRRHGIAGALSTAIATRYAFGDNTEEAVQNASNYIHAHIVYAISATEGRTGSRLADIYNGFLTLLAEHHTHRHDVAFYAERLCVSTRYLQEVTDKMAEKKPKQIISDLLMQKALGMLEGTRMTIQQISQYLGFASQAQFSRFFSKEKGVSPQAYRFYAGKNE